MCVAGTMFNFVWLQPESLNSGYYPAGYLFFPDRLTGTAGNGFSVVHSIACLMCKANVQNNKIPVNIRAAFFPDRK